MDDAVQPLVSIIIPVYNAESTLARALQSALRQTLSRKELEIILVDDGSTDSSAAICLQHAQKYPLLIKVIQQENGGVSKARNAGIKAARGKYLLFLDADDTISTNAARKLSSFFEQNREEVDIVCYKLKYLYANGKTSTHRRYKQELTQTGIYDLTLDANKYICQTTMNICVKNISNPILFDESLAVGEDQLYVTLTASQKQRLGYVAEAEYIYHRGSSTASRVANNPLYCFFDVLYFYDTIKRISSVHPQMADYCGALIVYNLGFRIASDTLWPYHLDEPEFTDAVKRVKSVVEDIDDALIVGHPDLDMHHRALILSWHQNAQYLTKAEDGYLLLYRDDVLLYKQESTEIVITRFKCNQTGRIGVEGFVRNPLFIFSNPPTVLVEVSSAEDETEKTELALSLSSWSYHRSKMLTTKAYNFAFSLPNIAGASAEISVLLHGAKLATNTGFLEQVPFSNENPLQAKYAPGNLVYTFADAKLTIGAISTADKHRLDAAKRELYRSEIKDLRVWAMRKAFAAARRGSKRIWLYYDCEGVHKDNGYHQFVHDFAIQDGIERYYVYNGSYAEYKNDFSTKQRKRIVRFRSLLHRLLFLQAELIVTAYIEQSNFIPFGTKRHNRLKDLESKTVVYLQHGILHATTPWKYSADRTLADYTVISTRFEEENLTQNYGYAKERLLACGMPRYDLINSAGKPRKRILFAPSWRNYLLNGRSAGRWVPAEGRFLASNYYSNIESFLKNSELHALLARHGYTLDFKLHPIFSCYKHLFDLDFGSHVRVVDRIADAAEYGLFVTDYSSMLFDFLYLERPALLYIPDAQEFKSGLATYRMLDNPATASIGTTVNSIEDLVAEIEVVIERNTPVAEQQAAFPDKLFFYYDNHQCDRVYEAECKVVSTK